MDQIILNGLARMKKATAWRGDGDIRGRIDEIVSEVKAIQKKMAKKGKEEYPEDEAEKYWDCYKMGLENKSPKVREATLLALQELIDESYITGEDSAEDESNPEKTLIDEISSCCCSCVEVEDDGVYSQLCRTLKSIITSHDTGIHGEYLINAIYAFFDSYTYCKSGSADEIRQNLIDVLTYVFKKVKGKSKKSKTTDEGDGKEKETAKTAKAAEEIESATPKHEVASFQSEAIYPGVESQMGFKFTGVAVEEAEPTVGESKNEEPVNPDEDPDLKRINDLPSKSYKDAFLLFRAICELATREDEENQPISATKLFALDILSPLIDNAGPDFNVHPAFIYAVRKYILPGILNNFISYNTRLVEVSINLFVSIIKKFLCHIKKEVEVFVSNIFIVILNSPNSSDKQKELILSAFEELLKDPQFAVSMFVNFDCDMSSINVYERIVITLNNVIQGNYVQIEKTPKIELEDEEPQETEEGEGEEEEEEEKTLEYTEARAKAIRCMNEVIKPLAERVHQFIEDELKKKQKADAEEEEDNEDEKPQVSDLAAQFDEKRRLQEEFALGVAKFNKKPRKGIEYLVSVGRIENTPESVAKFLYDHADDLDKTTIGDYLGEDKPFNLDVLAAYSSLIDYTDMDFDKAIKKFLSRFRLPGEAQKIDRIMEKFAAKFYECNPTVFDNADTAFVLGFSVIMLNTDLHNPNIPDEKKMKKEEFVSNNRGINDGKDLPRELLEGIYDTILTDPITLKEDDLAREKLAISQGKNENAELKRQRAFSLEKMEMMANAKLDVDPTKESTFVQVDKIDSYILPMYKLLHQHTYLSYSMVLQYIEEEEICKSVLESAHDMFTVASYYDLKDEKAQCIEAIAGCGFVTEEQWLLVTPVQVDAMKELIEMASKEYNYIGGGWKYVMKAISALSQIHMYGLTNYIKYQLTLHENVKTWYYDHSYYDIDSAKNIEEVVESICEFRTLDAIFLNSDKISNGIIDFVQALCEVSLVDIKEGMKKETEDEKERKKVKKIAEVDEDLDERAIHRPRVYLMQKIVEVADSNMNKRGRYDWTKIWELISDYLVTIGSMNNFDVAFTAIDGLKQLSLKFLDKEETKNFNFQKIFLRPFDSILGRHPSTEIKDLILHVIQNIILSRYKKLSSGWKTLMSALSCCAEDEDSSTTPFAWSLAKSLIDTYLDRIKADIPDIMNCYVYFIQCEDETIHSEAFSYLYKCAKIVLEDEIPELKTEMIEVNGKSYKLFDDNKVHISFWWPYFLGLCRFIPKDYRPDIRNTACERLFMIFNDPLVHFTKNFWSLILDLVFSIFNDLIATQLPSINELLSDTAAEVPEQVDAGTSVVRKIRSLSVVDGDVRSQTTAYYYLTDLVRLFIHKYDQLKDLFDMLIQFLHKCILQGMVDLARIAVQAYSILLIEGGAVFEEPIWNKLVDSIHTLYVSTSCEDLLEQRKALNILPLDGRVTGDKLDIGTYVKTNLGIGQIIDNKEQYFVVHLAHGKAYFQDYNAMEVVIPELIKARKQQEEEKKEQQEEEEEQEEQSEEEQEEEEKKEEEKEEEFSLTDTRTLSFDIELTVVHATVQLELSILLKSLIQEHYAKLSMENINVLLTTLNENMKSCDLFNQDEDFRTLLHNLGYMKESPNLPLLVRQHGICLSVYIYILFSLFTDGKNTDRVLYAKQQLLDRCGKLLTDYISYEQKKLQSAEKDYNAERNARALIPVINEIFDGFSSCTIESFKQYFLELYPSCVDIIEVGSMETRTHAAQFFKNKIGSLLFDKN